MRNTFLALLAALTAFSQVMTWAKGSGPSGRDLPKLHWATAAHASKDQQVAMFARWMRDRGEPEIQVAIEPESTGSQKIILQGVTGVAADVLEFGGNITRTFQGIGILHPLDVELKKWIPEDLSIDPAVLDEVSVDGRMYAYPAGVWTRLVVYHQGTFAKFGLAVPPERPTFEQFEAIGREFNRKGYSGKGPRSNFFFAVVGPYPLDTMRRSVGLGRLNETLSAPNHRDPRNIAMLGRLWRWIYEDHLMPSPAEAASMHVDQGIGGPNVQLFAKGQLASILMPLWPLMQLRQLGAFPMSAMLPPHGGYANSDLICRSIGVYTGSKNRDRAVAFAGFFASSNYEHYLAGLGDSAPANTKALAAPPFAKPVDYPNEWPMRSVLVKAHQQTAIGNEFCPFLLPGAIEKSENTAIQSLFSGILKPAQAAQQTADEVEMQMAAYLKRHPELATRYREAGERQAKIDALKLEMGITSETTPERLQQIAAGSKKRIPLALVDNPFYRRYYRDMGVGE